MSQEPIAIRIKTYKRKIKHNLYRTKCNQLIFMLKGLVIKQIQMRNQGKSMLKDISLKKNLLQSCDKLMVKCLSKKSIKDDDNPNDERGVFTLSVVKIESKPNFNCRKNETNV